MATLRLCVCGCSGWLEWGLAVVAVEGRFEQVGNTHRLAWVEAPAHIPEKGRRYPAACVRTFEHYWRRISTQILGGTGVLIDRRRETSPLAS